MFKAISALAAAAIVAAAITILLPGFSPSVEASAPAPVTKSDVLTTASSETACERQGWPYYETSCVRDRSRNAGRAKAVRIVTADRIPLADPFTDPNLLPEWPLDLAALQMSLPKWR